MRRKWITLTRIFRYGLNNFSRNTWLTTAATAVMVITLLMIMVTLVGRMVFADTLSTLRQKIDISVYLNDSIEETQRQQLESELRSLPVVSTVEFISKRQARELSVAENKDDADYLSAISQFDDSPLPASFKLQLRDLNKLNDISAYLNREDVKPLLDPKTGSSISKNARKDTIDNIARIAAFSEIAGLVACIIFVTISVMIIFNTIRMAIFNRKDEIEMMKLIGANKSFIRGPFIVEAALYGVLAAAISIVLIYTLLLTRAGELANYDIQIQPTIQFFQQWPVVVVLGQLIIGILIGIVSSLLAMRRYLKV